MSTSTTADKVAYLNETKTAIAEAIEAKGVTIEEGATFRSYATSIAAIETGGGSELVVVTIEETEEALTASHSYQEICDAFYAGKNVVAYHHWVPAYLPLLNIDEWNVYFGATTQHGCRYSTISISTEGTATLDDTVPDACIFPVRPIDSEQADYSASEIKSFVEQGKAMCFLLSDLSVNGVSVSLSISYTGYGTDAETGMYLAHFNTLSSASGELMNYHVVVNDENAYSVDYSSLGYTNGEEVSY